MRVLIVDDHPIVASGCRALLAGEPEIAILEAADAESGERMFFAERPDVCVLDINLPTVSGFELARRILARTETARIIMFSMNDDPVFAARAINSRRQGLCLEIRRPLDLVEAIREVGKRRSLSAAGDREKHRIRRTRVRPEPVVETDLARDRDLAPAQRGQEPFRDRVAGSFILQDDRQYLFHHSAEARPAHRPPNSCASRSRAGWCNTYRVFERRGYLVRVKKPRQNKTKHVRLRPRSVPAFPRRSAAMPSRLRAPRGGGSDFSSITRAGRSDRKNSRSANWIASARSCVTNNVVTLVRVVSAVSSWRSRSATASSSDTNGSSSRRKSGRTANARAIAARRARPSDNSPGYRARCALRPSVSTSSVRSAAACSRRQRKPDVLLDRAPGQQAAAPETQCRGARIRAPGVRPLKSASSPAAIFRIVVLPQPDGPISAPNEPASSRSSRPRTTSTGVPSADR